MAASKVTPEQFNAASIRAIETLEFWPKPKDILDILRTRSALPAYHNEYKPLPMPAEPPATPEQKREILEQMKPGARELFLTVVYGDQNGERKEA